MGNKTEANVVNETVNESVFSINNCTSIVNTLNQETVIVVNAEVGTTQEVWNSAKLTIENATIRVSGKGNTLTIGSNASADQKAKIIAQCAGVAAHSSDLTDAIMYSAATTGSSQQYSEMTSAAKATQTTECAASGLLSMSMSVGINNSVVSNVNNSIKNLFKMSVSNYMSSETRRNLLLKNITESVATIEQSSKNLSELSISGSLVELMGENNKLDISTSTSSTTESSLDSTVKSNASALTSAMSETAVSISNDVSSSQTAISKAEAAADGSTKVSSEGVSNWTIIILAIVAGAVGLGTLAINAWTTAKVCGNQAGINGAQQSNNPDIQINQTNITNQMQTNVNTQQQVNATNVQNK